jgi:hypothetical protein
MDSNLSGLAPGAQIDVDHMISSVTDVHIRAVLWQMHADNQRQHDNHQREMSLVTSMLQHVAADVRSLASQSKSAPPVVYPQFVGAAGDSPKSQSFSDLSSDPLSISAPSSLTDKVECQVGSGSVVVLRCLFCCHYHTIEKSHCQHYIRLRDRYVKSEHYTGKCVIPSNHWIFQNPAFGGASETEVIRNFIEKYLSHLASSNDKNINPERAAQLCSWLESIPRS